ncbi:MAG: hypothetical protein Q9169_005798 [Polycauliona sp. 2 TL-2023]
MGAEHGALETDLLTYIFDSKNGHPERPVLVDASNPLRFLTRDSAKLATRKLIAGLKAEGLAAGDCVCINAFNDIYYPILMLAIIGAGGRFTGSNPSYTSFELNHHIRTSHATFLFAEPPMLATTLQSATDCGIPATRVYTFDTREQAPVTGQKPWTDLFKHGEADWVTFNDPSQAKSTISTLSFTSGTTGFPKAAMISHLYAINQLETLTGQKPPYDVSRLICLPAFHAFAVPLLTGCAIRQQQTAYVMRRFDLMAFLGSIRRFRVTEIPLVPTVLIAILTSAQTTKEDLQSLRSVFVAGSPLRSSTQRNFQSLLHPDALVTQVWGMTETGWATMFFWPESDDTGSVGRLIPSMSGRLMAEDGGIITEDNRKGELLVKGTSMMNGYFNDPAATAATIDKDGWLHTGDIAYCIQGKWYIVDRKKVIPIIRGRRRIVSSRTNELQDMIKVHGWQVAPAEIEAVLLTHPQVINAAVIGIPLENGTGEVPQAFVVLKPRVLDGTYASHGELEVPITSEEDLKTHVAARLAKYKALKGVIFVDDIPRTASGKLQKVLLRALYAKLIMTQKRTIDEVETADDSYDVGLLTEAKHNGGLDVSAPENLQTGRGPMNERNGEDKAEVHKRVKLMPRPKVNRSCSSTQEDLMTDSGNDEHGRCVSRWPLNHAPTV